MKKKFFNLSLVLAFVLLLLAACGGKPASTDTNNETNSSNNGAEQEVKPEYTLRFGGSQPEDNLEFLTMKKFKEIAEEKSNGRIKVEVYPSNQLGTMVEMNESVRNNTQGLTYTSIAYIGGNYVSNLNALAMPFLITRDNLDHAYDLLDGEIGEALQVKLNEIGYQNLGYGPLGFRNITNSKHPIKTPDDLEGIKIRLQPNPVHLDTFETLGANPVGMDFAEVYSGLQQNVIDAQENPLSIIYDNKFTEVQDYLTVSGHFFDIYGMWMSKKIYDDLPEDLQKVVDEAGRDSIQFHRDEYFKNEEEKLELLQSEIEIHILTPEEIELFREKANPVYEKFLNETDDKEFAEKVFSELRK